MALVEGAALRVLAGEADGRAGFEERGVGEELGHAVVEGLACLSPISMRWLETVFFDLGVDVEAFGRGGDGLR